MVICGTGDVVSMAPQCNAVIVRLDNEKYNKIRESLIQLSPSSEYVPGVLPYTRF